MFSFLGPLLLVAQVAGQQPQYQHGLQPTLVQLPPAGMPQQSPSGYGTNYQQSPYSTNYQQPLSGQQSPYSAQTGQPALQAVYQPLAEPPPSRYVIEQERDQFIKESAANVEFEIQKLGDEVESAKRTFVAEQEKAKQQYLVMLESNQQKHFQALEAHLGARTQEARKAAQEYAARIEKQAQELIHHGVIHHHHQEHQTEVQLVADQEKRSKEELEQQIRAAYDASRYGGAFSDPSGPVQEARNRFDEQMAELQKKRQTLQGELQQNLAAAASALSAAGGSGARAGGSGISSAAHPVYGAASDFLNTHDVGVLHDTSGYHLR